MLVPVLLHTELFCAATGNPVLGEGFTAIVNVLLVDVGLVAHDKLVVITTLTISPLANALSRYVELFVPTFKLFFFH